MAILIIIVNLIIIIILFTTRWVLKIADFGLGDLLDEAPLPHLLYQAPELLR